MKTLPEDFCWSGGRAREGEGEGEGEKKGGGGEEEVGDIVKGERNQSSKENVLQEVTHAHMHMHMHTHTLSLPPFLPPSL